MQAPSMSFCQVLINLFLLISEVFTEFYTGSTHAVSARYLFFGLEGYNALVPWIWTSIVLNVVAVVRNGRFYSVSGLFDRAKRAESVD